MARKLNRNVVALGSAAIIAVYGVGLARTRAPSDSISPALAAATAPATTTAMTAPPTTDAATAIARAIATATPAPATPNAGGITSSAGAGPSTSTTTTTAYRDGTYTGSGTSRFGGFEVAVTIAAGQITTVDITKATTKYPASRVSRLPGQVVERQSAAVDTVSGATASSQAFRGAVSQALAKAVTGSAQS